MTLLKYLFRILCYFCLLLLILGFASLVLLRASGLCPVLNEANIACTTSFATTLAEAALTVVLLSIFTGVPVLLALGGVGFAIYDVFFRKKR